MADKVANVLAGTVTLTVRAFMNNRGRFLQLAKEENIFGGGRFNFVHDTCPLDMKSFIEELKLAQGDIESIEEIVGQDSLEQQEDDKKQLIKEKAAKEITGDGEGKALPELAEENKDEVKEAEVKPKTRRRKKREE